MVEGCVITKEIANKLRQTDHNVPELDDLSKFEQPLWNLVIQKTGSDVQGFMIDIIFESVSILLIKQYRIL